MSTEVRENTRNVVKGVLDDDKILPEDIQTAGDTSEIGTVPSLNHVQMPNVDSIICRICHNYDRVDRLISPCLCKGTLSYVHRSCLEYWLSRANLLHCELCLYRFQTNAVLKYKCCESMGIWYRHPNNRGLLLSDILIFTLMTIVTFALVSMSLFGLQHFIMQGTEVGLSKFWTQGSVITFLVIVLMAYLVNVSLIVRAQIRPWYRWWRSTRIVRLVIPDVCSDSQRPDPCEPEVVINR